MVGGMVNEANGANEAIESGRNLILERNDSGPNKTYWEPLIPKLWTRRAFLCGVTVRDAAFVVTGGYSSIAQSVTEVLIPHYRYSKKPVISDMDKKALHNLNIKQRVLLSVMTEARSGHGCSGK